MNPKNTKMDGGTEKKNQIKDTYGHLGLPITLFVTGGVIMMLELLGTRIVAPYYGTTLYVWSSLITVTLVFLSLGYFLGGRIIDKKPRTDILYLVIFCAGLSVIFIPAITSPVMAASNPLGPRLGSLTSAFVLFSLPMTLLGMVMPSAIKLGTEHLEDVGMTSGVLISVSTLGSFVGTVCTGFFLIPSLGVSKIVYLIAFLLFGVSGIWFMARKMYRGLVGIAIIFSLLYFYSPQTSSNPDLNIAYSTESTYGQIMVVDEGNARYLLFDGATQSEYDMLRKEFTFPYLRLMEKSIGYHPNPKTALSLGLGAGGIEQKFRGHGIDVDSVEIDPKVVDVAKNYFDFEGGVIVDDGRHYVRYTDKKYDIIVLDTYGGYSTVPHLLTKEAFTEMKGVLNENGILTINVMGFENGHLSTEDEMVKAICRTLEEVFPHVYVKTTGYGFTSMVFYASDQPLELDWQFVSIEVVPDENTPILTDDYNPVEIMGIPSAEKFREDIMERFGNVP
ncbi:MAG: fused MFS/spermidine synthase [Methanocellales archaeon]|nr:fused MFS/spermidine synthase [Methanocellales archaeon]